MRIYLAGAEHSDVAQTLESGAIRHAFASYYYVRKMPGAVARVRKHAQSLTVDSGAHSFFAATPSMGSASNTVTKPRTDDPEQFAAAYRAWLKANIKDLDHFVELDIGELVGQAAVERWRAGLVKDGLADRCIIVWHPRAEPWDKFIATARKWPSRYVALEGLRRGKPAMDYVAAVRALYEGGVMVHGFAMVKRRWLDRIPFYSVDSNSFKAAVRFGTVFSDVGSDRFGYVRFTNNRNARPRMAQVSVRTGASPLVAVNTRKSATRDGGKSSTIALVQTARTMAAMEDYYTRLWAARGIRWDRVAQPARRRSRKSRSRG